MKHPYIPEGCREPQGRVLTRCSGEPCGRGQVACPFASACHVPQAEPPERMGPMHGWERFWLRNGAAILWGATLLLAIAGALAWTK